MINYEVFGVFTLLEVLLMLIVVMVCFKLHCLKKSMRLDYTGHQYWKSMAIESLILLTRWQTLTNMVKEKIKEDGQIEEKFKVDIEGLVKDTPGLLQCFPRNIVDDYFREREKMISNIRKGLNPDGTKI